MVLVIILNYTLSTIQALLEILMLQPLWMQFGLGAKMELYAKILETYPELENQTELFMNGTIHLQDDSDGLGAYIAKWDYSKPIPDGLSLGKS
jgi:hypothetical protein